MRVFRREEVLREITETDRVTHLECIGGGRDGGVGGTKWAYGLANGESRAMQTHARRFLHAVVLRSAIPHTYSMRHVQRNLS